jgi:fluoride ion exporter CrcB/FEX
LIALFLYYNPTDTTKGFLITGFLGALTTFQLLLSKVIFYLVALLGMR